MRWSRLWIAGALAGIVAAALVVVLAAPASLVDLALRRLSNERIALTETKGSVWSGSGRLVFVDVAAPRAEGLGAMPVLAGVAVPGRLSWQLQRLPLVFGLIDAQVELIGMSDAVPLSGNVNELRIGPGRLALPQVDLGQLGSPWNTIRPAGALALRWDAMVFRNQGFEGQADIELRGMASALSPVRPLGDYHIGIRGEGARAVLSIETLQGPLRLTGSGTWDARAGVRFDAQAWADEAERQRLDPFLGMIGRRVNDRTMIRIGA